MPLNHHHNRNASRVELARIHVRVSSTTGPRQIHIWQPINHIATRVCDARTHNANYTSSTPHTYSHLTLMGALNSAATTITYERELKQTAFRQLDSAAAAAQTKQHHAHASHQFPHKYFVKNVHASMPARRNIGERGRRGWSSGMPAKYWAYHITYSPLSLRVVSYVYIRMRSML